MRPLGRHIQSPMTLIGPELNCLHRFCTDLVSFIERVGGKQKLWMQGLAEVVHEY
jgi:hypothetical protein